MDQAELARLLDAVAAGEVSSEEATRLLSPTAELGFANLDLHREQRSGLPEAVYAEGKSDSELEGIIARLLEERGRVLVTRLEPSRSDRLARSFPEAIYHRRARVLTAGPSAPTRFPETAPVAVVSAGTADLAVAEEATVVARWHGLEVERYDDVGVAGVHRLLARLEEIRRAPVVIVVAGMDGALPTVVAGLVRGAVVAAPTSVGYGASFSGLAALLTMLNACAPGIAVVNIDSGYGAAACACRILGASTSIASP